MNDKANHQLTNISKILRRNLTDEEKHLWYDFLKGLPITVNRQKVIGNYIADFYCAKAKIVIGIDGEQHYRYMGRKNDIERDKYFSTLGLRVLRYSNLDVNNNFKNICNDIWLHLFNQK